MLSVIAHLGSLTVAAGLAWFLWRAVNEPAAAPFWLLYAALAGVVLWVMFTFLRG
jgi:hypothetical protein